jgi:prophage antirepressor-like protein
MNFRVENWLDYEIRFVEKNPGEWWAVLKDITDALGLTTKKVNQRLNDEVLSTHHVPDSLGEMLLISAVKVR